MSSYEGLLFLAMALVLIAPRYLDRWLAHRHRIATSGEIDWSHRNSTISQFVSAVLWATIGAGWLFALPALSTTPVLGILQPVVGFFSFFNAVRALARGIRLWRAAVREGRSPVT